MNRIKIKNLILKNFKGIKDLSVDFGNITNIKGANASGKTTVFDAFCWLLFNKDSQDRKDFDIKTIDHNGEVIHNLEHQVTGIIDINGKLITLSKIYKEKWTKSKGSNLKSFTGNDTLRYINEVPVSMREYEDKIKSIINEQLFKLISNPLFFGNNLKWQERRKVILDIAGDIDDTQVVSYKPELGELVRMLDDEDFETFKRHTAAKRKKCNDDIKSIPFRIDECTNSIKDIDFEAYELRKRVVKSGLNSIDSQIIQGSSLSKEILEKKDKLYKLRTQIADIEYYAEVEADKPKLKLRQEVSTAQIEKAKLKQDHLTNSFNISNNKQKLSDIEGSLNELKNQFTLEAAIAIKFPEGSFICPICKRPFEVEDENNKRLEMIENFNINKAKKLKEINVKGQAYNLKVKSFEAANAELDNNATKLSIKLVEVTAALISKQATINTFIPELHLENNQEYQKLLKEVTKIENDLKEPATIKQAVVDLKAKKIELETEIDVVNKTLAVKENNTTLKERIKDLEIQERDLGEKIALLDKQDFLCQEFMKAKVELLENNINNKFKIVKFKMFDTLIKGALVENCVATVNGVPFESLNSAMTTNAGLDIINTLSDHYQTTAPIFVDNAEGINELIPINTQLIRLEVTKDKVLKIETED